MKTETLEMQALYYKALEDYKLPEEEKHDEAFSFLTQAAEMGFAEAAKMLGTLYLSGQYAPFPEKDDQKAIAWFQKAAKEEDEEAMYWLSQCFEMGVGVPKNRKEAKFWRRKAIAGGFQPEEDEESETEPEPVVKEPEPVVNEPEEEAKAPVETKIPEKLPAPASPVTFAWQTEPLKKPADNTYRTPIVSDVPESVGRIPSNEEEAGVTAEKVKEAAKGLTQQEKEQQQKKDSVYETRFAVVHALVLGGVTLVLCALLYAVLPAMSVGAKCGYLAVVIALVSVMAAWGNSLGHRTARDKIRQNDEYRQTAFYRGFGVEKSRMNAQENWCYSIYETLSKDYLPINPRQHADPAELRKYRGALYAGWSFFGMQGTARPEFVLLTAKAVYVIHTLPKEFASGGRLDGDLQDFEWSFTPAKGRSSGTKNVPETMRNLFDENEESIRQIASEMAGISSVATEKLPFINVIALPEGVKVSQEIKDAVKDEQNRVLVCGRIDLLRSRILVKEAKLPVYDLSMERLVKLFGRLGDKMIEREWSDNHRE